MRACAVLGLLILAATLAGCVTTENRMLDERNMIVSASGMAGATLGSIMQSVVQAAAKEGHARGFAYFQIVRTTDTTTTDYVQQPVTTDTTSTASSQCYSIWCNARESVSTTTSGGGVTAVINPGADVQVRFFRDGEVSAATPDVWSVASILAVAQK